MGCGVSCVGGEEDEIGAGPKEDRYPVGVERKITSTYKDEWEESKWQDDIREIWNRTLWELPTYMDLPRLATRMEIYDAEGDKLTEDVNPQNYDKLQIMYQIFVTLAEALNEEDEFQEKIKDTFYEYLDPDNDGETTQQLRLFLKEVITEDTLVGKVMKACHQKMIFSAFYCIKNRIWDKLPFKDKRGTWFIYVLIRPNNVVEIRHRKTQTGKPEGFEQEGDFAFSWELRLVTSANMEELESISIHITTISFKDEIKKKRRQQIEKLFHQMFEEELELEDSSSHASSSSSEEDEEG
eukprot:CAMPEP_0174251788 /NCGR_PEP_ID=MMETSP0439-20130205/1503_1 /TAXON_ID=0 /ORGANISM="Stereomyxa ramosa, Strain Chinc5" /LENGTH=295 /DNA_ID=CAMNT_0015332201 /DNA_START=64 /DNA_END=951 /DNA_ORIENTATION=+